MPKEYDPMADTDKAFYELINNQPGEWITNIEKEPENFDTDFHPQFVEYHMPGPVAGMFIRVSMPIEDILDLNNIQTFMINLNNFLFDEDEKYA